MSYDSEAPFSVTSTAHEMDRGSDFTQIWYLPFTGLRWSSLVFTGGMDQGSNFRDHAVPLPPCLALFHLWSSTLVWYPPSAGFRWPRNHPSQPLRSTLLVVPEPPCPPFVARAAAANVNPRTRLSHMTGIPLLLGS